MFKKHQQNDPPYSEAEATRWLSWLAGNMQRHDQTIFLIEELQPDWLVNRRLKWVHFFRSILIVGLIGAMIGGIVGGVAPVFESATSIKDVADEALFRSKVLFTFVTGLAVGYLLGIIFGVVFSIKYKGNIKIKLVEKINWSWSTMRKNAKKGMQMGFLTGALFGPISGIFVGYVGGIAFGLIYGLILGLILGLVCGVLGILFSGFDKGIPKIKTTPNQGIQITNWNALIMGMVISLISGLIFAWLSRRVYSGLIFGCFFGFIGWLAFGGMAVIQHYALRLIIYIKGYGPWNYARFLDYVAHDLQFMQRVGGGYIFIHRMLLEHFAAMESDHVPGKTSEKEPLMKTTGS